MPSLAALVGDFLRGPRLPLNAGRTFQWHRAYAVLDAAAGGVLLNAPMVALKTMDAPTWNLPLRELLSGVGMIAALYLGSWMATRRKMPFVFIPGVLAASCSFSMVAVSGYAFWFLLLFGVSALFEIVTRPAVAAILRNNYPVEHRGHATGEVRKWSSLVFVASSIGSALILHGADVYVRSPLTAEGTALGNITRWEAVHAAQILLVMAGLLSLSSFICFRQIRVEEDPARQRHDLRPEIGKSFGAAVAVVVRDRRYQRWLVGCALDGFFTMLYFPLIWAFFDKPLGFGYVSASAFMHAIPALVAFLMTGVVGRLIDRSNPWVSWAWIRFAWGCDALLLAATPYYAALFLPALYLLPLVGRVLRGSVQGGSWIMWWQVGVTHFAPPGDDTSRYLGVLVFLNGLMRFAASGAGMILAAVGVPVGRLLVIGGLGVIASGFYSLYQAARERREHAPETMTEFETAFLAANGAQMPDAPEEAALGEPRDGRARQL
jgi:hypothetical protein